MSFKIFFIVTIVILFIPVSGLCIDYYVDSTSGSDENSGLSPDNAWKTITYAISQVIGSESDTAIINISAGTYSPSTGEIFPIVMKDNVVLIGAGKGLTIIDAEDTNGVIICTDLTLAGIANLTITNGKGDYGGGVWSDESTIVLMNCNFSNNKSDYSGGGVSCNKGANIVIDNCDFKDNYAAARGGGIYFLIHHQLSQIASLITIPLKIMAEECTAKNTHHQKSQKPLLVTMMQIKKMAVDYIVSKIHHRRLKIARLMITHRILVVVGFAVG